MRGPLAWVPILIWLVAGCGPLPFAAPTPTPTSLKPPNLLTPRPTLPPAVTPTPFIEDDARPQAATERPLRVEAASSND
ncbi:MAG TPA: hypothetical protein VGJ60_12650, partial [Chloroflexota bacterium]